MRIESCFKRQLTKALPLVLGDRVQLKQVLQNLIKNGIEAMTTVANRPRLLWVKGLSISRSLVENMAGASGAKTT